MRALQYTFSIPNFLAVRAADRLPLKILESGKIPGLAEKDLPPMTLPASDWVRVRPRLAGICGSDISTLTNRSSPALMPFVSFPAVLGHEVVGEVVEVGSTVETARAGDRVVIDPVLSCAIRGLAPCDSCARGQPGLCTNAAEGKIAPAMLIGFCRDLPGGWSQEMVVHQSQVYRVPELLSDETAVLVEPFSVAVHAALKALPPPEAKVLIIGGGSIGLLTLAALRLLGVKAEITILVRHAVQERMATTFGADRVVRGGSAGDAAIERANAKKYQPLKGKHVYAGGFDWVYDCVGSKRSVDESLRVAAPGGHVVMVGCAGEVPKLDLTFVWSAELQVTGCYVYGQEHACDGSPHTFDVALRLLEENPSFPLAEMVTHRIPLSRWREALQISLARGQHAAIKVVFDCQS